MSLWLAQYMARCGAGSRRQAIDYIKEGRVQVNGQVVRDPALKLKEDDKVVFDNMKLSMPPSPRMWCYHKPAGLLVSRTDPEGRKTIYDALPDEYRSLIAIGRLDLNSEGLLLLTNNGALSRHMTLPANGWRRHYRVRVRGMVSAEHLKKLTTGITIDDVFYKAEEAYLDNQQSSNAWLSIILAEGKNREIRKMCDHLGLTVNRLIRTEFGGIDLGSLEKGEIEEIPQSVLIKILGDKNWQKICDA